MKNRKRITVGILVCFLLLLSCMPAFAADNVNIKLVPDPIEDGEDYLTMTYNMSGGGSFTSGKFTITYDTQYLEYSDHDLGGILAATMSNVKDPYQDQGKEGEIVIAFSSDQPVKANDTLLDLYFDLKENAKNGQQYNVNIKVDELYNGSTKLTPAIKETPITVGDTAAAEEDEEFSDESEETETETETQTQAQTQAQTQPQTQKQTAATTAATKATETTARGANAKTGDNTRILPFAAAGFLAVMILGGLALGKKKQKE